MASERITLTIDGRDVSLSNPNRVVWPEVGVTKHELAEYVIAVAEPFLRANGHRPVSLERFPDTVDGERFFSKNPPKGAPDFVHEVMCTYNSGRKHPQVVLDEAAATASAWIVRSCSMPVAASASRSSRWARESGVRSAVACTSTRPPSPVMTTFASTSAVESSA